MENRYSTLIFLALTLFGPRGALAAQNSAPPPQDKASIQGRVTTVPNSEPLKGVRVRLTRGSEDGTLYVSVSDGAGQFSIQNIEPGIYQIRIEKDGYRTPDRVCSSSAIQDDDLIKLIAGQSLSDLKFQMLTPAVITGHVFDSSGDAITDALVGAYLVAVSRGHRFMARQAAARTDDRGQYRLFHLEPGQYFLRLDDAFRLRLELEEQTNKDAAEVLGFRPIYYPDTFERDQAMEFTVRPGQEIAEINFTAHLANVLRVRGKVVNGITNEPMVDVNLAIEPRDAGVHENEGTSHGIGEDGTFEVSDLTPGRYLVSAMARKLPDRRVWHGQHEIELKDSSLNVLVPVFPGHDVSGRIEVQGGVKIDLTRLQVQLEPHTDVSYGFTYAKVNADATFFIPDLGQDVYDVGLVGLPPLYFLKSTILGDVEIADNKLKIGTQPESPLILKVSKPSAEVTGEVQTADGKRACSAQVVLVPENREHVPSIQYMEVFADQFGSFSFKDIIPGDYRLYAWDQNSPVPYLEHGALEPYETQGQAVHLKEGDRLTVPVKLISGEGSNP